MTTSVLEIVGQVLVVLGGIVFLTAGLGLLKLPDVYTRTSAISTAAGFGIVQVVIGALLIAPALDDTIKVVLAVVLQLATSAIGSMALARAAYTTGSPLVANTSPDAISDDTPDDRTDAVKGSTAEG
ncbi:cation:proton antiporter [Oerskovia flava]|uniref:cation:proton antiporter n=1 Tax=Oerskovia flava TaxID=2986422 RepID=UPI00223F1E73|nr:monovalent cation/H(+) antiporter subunit G [Oerskovia sp. JB1-3-2]